MLKTYETKSMTPEQRAEKEVEYERLISAAMFEENLAEARRLRAERRAMRGGIFPPERIGANEVRVFDARGKKDAPELLFDPSAPEKPLYCGTARVLKTPSQMDRWR